MKIKKLKKYIFLGGSGQGGGGRVGGGVRVDGNGEVKLLRKLKKKKKKKKKYFFLGGGSGSRWGVSGWGRGFSVDVNGEV